MNVGRIRGVLLVRLTGADLADPVALHKRFEELIIHESERRLVADLSAVSYMNSMQIGAVVGLHLLAYENLAVMKFVGLRPRIQDLFKLLGVDTLLDMHYARAKNALESFGVLEDFVGSAEADEVAEPADDPAIGGPAAPDRPDST